MEALVRCVARYGLDGATLSVIAKEAGLSRPLIRHHLGNRDEIVAALQEFVLRRFAEESQQLIAALPPEAKSKALVDYLFSEEAEASPDMVLAFAALTSRASENATLREACKASVLEFEREIAKVLRAEHPNATEEDVIIASHGIIAIYFNMTSLAPLKMPKHWHQSVRAAAHHFLQALEKQQ